MTEALPDAFRNFAESPTDELDIALLVNRAISESAATPQLFDPRWITARIVEVVEQVQGAQTPWHGLKSAGFQGNRDDYQLLDNSRVDWVLENRLGIPITLGVLLIHVARELGEPATGINFPGHFLVRVGAALVDPFELDVTNEADCLARLSPEQREAPESSHFAMADPVALGLRMLNNVKYHFAAKAAWSEALHMLDCQLGLVPRDSGLLLEQGDLWTRLGAPEFARRSFLQARDAAQDGGAVAALVEQRLNALSGQRQILH